MPSTQLQLAFVGCGVIFRHHLAAIALLPEPRRILVTAVVEPNDERRKEALVDVEKVRDRRVCVYVRACVEPTPTPRYVLSFSEYNSLIVLHPPPHDRMCTCVRMWRACVACLLQALGNKPQGFTSLSAAAEADPEMKLFTAVDIMVPSLTNLHETVGVEALNLGYHVHLEKPISESVESAERLIAAVPEGKVLMIAENSAYWREIVEAKRLIDAGTIGDVLTARCKFWESGQ